MKSYFLFNPLAGKGRAEQFALELDSENTHAAKCYDMTKIDSFPDFLSKLETDDCLIVCGGDGTLNGFINKIEGLPIKNDVFYFPAGSGNDFMKDLGRTQTDGKFEIGSYIKDLPKVTINGKDYHFINGVGFGIDGVVCGEGDRQRQRGKRVNYTLLAVKCLLKFKPVNATLTVDGVKKSYKKVWMTTTMKGKYLGGGMKMAPDQDRNSEKNEITVMVAHNLSRFKILTLFPSVFEGKHTKYTKYVDLIKCHSIDVEYDIPCTLQMDGEPIYGVRGYSAISETKNRVTKK